MPPEGDAVAVVYSEAAAETWKAWLSEAERKRRDAFGAASRKREFLAGRAAARSLLARHLGCTPADVPLQVAADGAVDVPGTRWHLSIAHTGPKDAPRAVAVCAPHPIGVDLEQIRLRSPALRRFLFAPEDRALPDALPHDANTALLLCWTLKEAVLKARRSGFRLSPKALRLHVDAAATAATARVDGGATWRLAYTRWMDAWCAVAWGDGCG
jgi:4'-phosphopantetheinyl transferase